MKKEESEDGGMSSVSESSDNVGLTSRTHTIYTCRCQGSS